MTKAWPERKCAVENAVGVGHHLGLWLVALGEHVVDVPTTATARVRQFSWGGRRKNDRIDAAACVAALKGEARPVRGEDLIDSLALLDERRVHLSRNRTRTLNRLHTLLHDLLAGGAPTSLTPNKATAALRGFHPLTPSDKVRRDLCKDLIADVPASTDNCTAAKRIARLLDEHGTTLREVDAVGLVLAARILGRTGRPGRFPAAAYANYTGTAPVQVAQRRLRPAPPVWLRGPATGTPRSTRWRWSRSGCPAAWAAHHDTKIAEGKTPRGTRRSLKRHSWHK